MNNVTSKYITTGRDGLAARLPSGFSVYKRRPNSVVAEPFDGNTTPREHQTPDEQAQELKKAQHAQYENISTKNTQHQVKLWIDLNPNESQLSQ